MSSYGEETTPCMWCKDTDPDPTDLSYAPEIFGEERFDVNGTFPLHGEVGPSIEPIWYHLSPLLVGIWTVLSDSEYYFNFIIRASVS